MGMQQDRLVTARSFSCYPEEAQRFCMLGAILSKTHRVIPVGNGRLNHYEAPFPSIQKTGDCSPPQKVLVSKQVLIHWYWSTGTDPLVLIAQFLNWQIIGLPVTCHHGKIGLRCSLVFDTDYFVTSIPRSGQSRRMPPRRNVHCQDGRVLFNGQVE